MRVPNLPIEIIREILECVPVKSLCRFRCVSKTWLSLISDPHFVKSHFNKASEHDPVLCQRRRVVIRDSVTCRLYSLDLDDCLDQTAEDNNVVGEDDVVLVVPNLIRRRRFSDFVICCNGLLFVRSRDVFYVLNPATCETKIVPNPPQVYLWTDKLFGFGYNETTRDYEVVRGEFSENDIGFSVYSLTNDSWRVIQRRYSYVCFEAPVLDGKLMNGGVHWFVCRICNDVASLVLVSFVFADEELQEIPLPPDLLVGFNIENYYDERCYFVDVFRDCLRVGKNDEMEFWIMKEYGVAKSWTKMSSSLSGILWLDSGFVKNNCHLLLDLNQNRLVMYNFDDGSFQTISVGDSYEVDFVGCYLESLVSPHHYDMIDGEH